jgi:hypothetical protein
MLVEATKLKISMATDADNLKEMFQVNKALYGKLKELNPLSMPTSWTALHQLNDHFFKE